MHPLSVCVFCSASTSIPRTYQDLAAETGRGIAERGWTLVTGGEAVSMMGAVADAARAAGGRTVGVVPEALLHKADRDAGELVVLPSVSQRKATMITRSDALLALPGGVGTCDEIFESWTTRMLVPHSKPLVLLDHEGHFGELVSWADRMHRTGFISHEWRSALRVATTVAEALDMCATETPVTTRPGHRAAFADGAADMPHAILPDGIGGVC